ncbi:MAG: M20 family peptidase [Alphaproteobacteria bacterium]|nr:M20 family peptidase [Alphaproteobacteria bacterium]
MWKWILGAISAAVVALGAIGGVMVYRTAQLTAAPAAAEAAGAAAPIAIDADAAARRLSQAIQIQTVSRTEGVVEDPETFAALHLLLAREYPRAHAALQHEIVLDHSLLFTWSGSDPALAPILLLAHQDVVPVEAGTEGDWEQPPFSGAIANGYVWGRGAVDDKGSLIAIFEGMEALLAQGFQPRRTVLLAFGHDEETLGGGASAIAALLQQRSVRPWFVLDEGMAVVEDFPLTGGPVALIGIAEKGYMSVRVTARADGGHSSMPQADTAAERLSRAILALRANPFPGGLDDGPTGQMLQVLAPQMPYAARLAIANRWAFNGVLIRQTEATPSGNALLRTTIAPTMIDGGAKENVLPQEMHAIVNLRLHPRDTVDSALAHLRAAVADIPNVTIEPEGTPSNPSPVSATDSDSYRLIEAAARTFAPEGAPVAPMLVLGATDSRHFAGVAENVYRFAPMRAPQSELGRIHGTGERMSVENLTRMAQFYAELVRTGAQ